MNGDATPKQAAEVLGISERTVRRRLAIYRLIVSGKRVAARDRALAIPYRHRLGVPYQIPAECLEAIRRVEVVA